MKTTVPFRLFQINTEEFATFPELLEDESEINLNTGLSYGIDEEGHAIKCIIRILFESNSKVFIMIQVSCEFEIELDIFKGWTKGKKAMTIPKEFATHLAILTAGTARGVLHTKTENTYLNKFFLPTVNINELVVDNIKIEL